MVIVFLILQFLGMINYPGGTIWDEYSSSYLFTKNYFSDLGRFEAHSGEPNYLSMIFFTLSLFLVSITFIFHYMSVLTFFAKSGFCSHKSTSVNATRLIITLGFFFIIKFDKYFLS